MLEVYGEFWQEIPKMGQIDSSVVSPEIDNSMDFPLWNTSYSSILTFCFFLLSCVMPQKTDAKIAYYL